MKSKLLVIAFMIVLMIQSVGCYQCQEADYWAFLTKYDRNPEDEVKNEDYLIRYGLYCKGKEFIEETNSKDLGYTVGEWQWMDRTDDEVNKLIKLGISLEDITAGTQPVPTEELRKLKASPSSLDYRAQGKVSSIKSQGSCGCCWSFTTVGLYESWMMFKGEAEYDLSEQYLLECTTKFTRNIKNRNLVSDCGGGYLDQAIGLAKLNGLPLESAYPYLAKNYQSSSGYPTTPGICSTKSTYVYGQDPSKISAYTSQNNTHQQMKDFLATYGPVAVAIYANTGFTAYTGGIYSGCPSFSTSYANLNHAVIVVGYDSNGNYIIKNSWNTGWGVNGFGIVSKDADCGISAVAYMLASNVAPGGGLAYSGQVDLDSGSSSFGKYLAQGLTLGLALVMVLLY